MNRTLFTSIVSAVVLLSATVSCQRVTDEQQLAREIAGDERMQQVKEMALEMIATGFDAGDAYAEVWIRDYTTFMELAMEVHDHEDIRENLRVFFRFQAPDGGIVDGFKPTELQWPGGYDYIFTPLEPDRVAHKNTVETDHEASLIQGVYRYIQRSGDVDFLQETIDGQTIAERLLLAVDFLLNERMSEQYGLIWGATTTDWGDVQPEHEWGVFITDDTHFAVEIYDNAMFLIALKNLAELLPNEADRLMGIYDEIAANAMEHLWDPERRQFVPHRYLDGSPFPDDFEEDAIYQHGGTAMAIQAGLLDTDEVRHALERMRANVRAAGAATIGLTLYPPYPEGFFMNPGMGPFSYQNGGDWTWFGGRMIHQLQQHGLVWEAWQEAVPMFDRVLENDGFYEWYTIHNEPMGSGTFRGSAGVLFTAIEWFEAWAAEQLD